MRIGASFILIEGYCYQSYQWKFLRPLGRLSHVLSFLDKYEVDEICITRPIRKVDSSSTLLNDFEQVKLSLSNSPISIGGGIRSLKNLKALSELPVERIHFSHAFLSRKENIINQSINLYGKQAIVATQTELNLKIKTC
jgi:Imidazoleglycerol-phosphate synthase